MEPEETPRPSAALALDQGLRGLIAEAHLWRERSDIFKEEHEEVLEQQSQLREEIEALAGSAQSFRDAYRSTNTPLPSGFDEMFINMLCYGTVISASDVITPEPDNGDTDDEITAPDPEPTPGSEEPPEEPPSEPEGDELDPDPEPDPDIEPDPDTEPEIDPEE